MTGQSWAEAYQYKSFEHFKRETFSIVAGIAERIDGPIRMADVSCGPAVLDGILLTRLGDRIEQIHLLDVEPGLLDLAKRHLSKFNVQLTTHIFEFNSPADYPQLCGLDLIVSTNAVFHATRDALPAFYSWCHSALSSGGVLLNHQTFGSSCPGFDQKLERLCPHLQSRAVWDELDTELARRAQPEQVPASADLPDNVGTYVGVCFPVQEHLQVLRSTGFLADEIWRKGTSAMIMAVKNQAPT